MPEKFIQEAIPFRHYARPDYYFHCEGPIAVPFVITHNAQNGESFGVVTHKRTNYHTPLGVRHGAFRHCRIEAVLFFLVLLMVDAWARGHEIALVLSGGGSRGIAQIGVLKAFEEEKVKPDRIVCTSMGAIIGSLYAVGFSADELEQLAKTVDLDNVFADEAPRRYQQVSKKHEPTNYLLEMRFGDDLKPLLPQSISHGQIVYDLLVPRLTAPAYHAGMDFSALPIELRIIGTDIVTGTGVVFSNGNLAQAVRASCGVPLAFSPTAVEDKLVLDGGLTANIPTRVAVAESADLVIAVDVTSPLWERPYLDNPIRIADQVINIGMNRLKKEQRELADIIIEPNLVGFRNTDFHNIDALIERGYIAAKKRLPEIKRRIEGLQTHAGADSAYSSVSLPLRWGIVPPPLGGALDSLSRILTEQFGTAIPPDTLGPLLRMLLDTHGYAFGRITIVENHPSGARIALDPGIINEVLIHGNLQTSARLIKTTSGLHKGRLLRAGLIEEAMRSLNGTGLFATVNIDVDTSRIVHIRVKEKPYWRMRFGLRYDRFHLGEGYIQPGYENLFGTGVNAQLHLQFGLRREKYALEIHGSPLFTSNWASSIRTQAYLSKERIIIRKESPRIETVVDTVDSSLIEVPKGFWIDYQETEVQKRGVMLKVGTEVGRVAMLNIGLRFEKYEVGESEKSPFDDPLGQAFAGGIRYLMVGLTVDDLDRYPFPLNGHKHYITMGGASDAVGGTENFITLRGSLGRYFTVGGRHTFFPQIRFAWADKALPNVERVFLGGAISEEKYRDIGVFDYSPFMGLRPRSLAGDNMLVFHGEYRLALGEELYASAALDWGYTWYHPDFSFAGATARDFIDNAPLGLGLGFAYQSLIGPIRLSWGRLLRTSDSFRDQTSIEENNIIYFSIGHDF
ncbi:MAG: BamA/TamA family outer membrane protein [Chitinivibrionales bacterium]|nr:BamA/TamA family outer membrane protein [Chitinivibrionales bacterium]MBD3357452.1 BamA/TamA family outer membrane protein [Chitinivibrionales bacterium]